MRPPVDPAATPEAQELLAYLYSVQGTLSGQHNQMWHMSEPSERIQTLTGKYPRIWGGEWGFSDERHDIDNVKYRPRLLDEIRKQHAAGRIIVMSYHQASPTIGEPCDFVGGVQVNLTEDEWDGILSKGTPLNQVWADHVDQLAEALLTLQKEKIPVIFRPYHEMNGGWFWWGGDAERFKALWAITFNRFVNYHGLHNLLWAWNPDKPHEGVEAYFPGHDTVDLLGTDIYPPQNDGETYPQAWYDRMAALAEGKPLALSEMSKLPTSEELTRQPWTYLMGWDDLVFQVNTGDEIRAFYTNPSVDGGTPNV
jgi:mannan endo-1,4-beta-mannosidase